MATIIQFKPKDFKKTTTIGYTSKQPSDVIDFLFQKYHIVQYNNAIIPTRSTFESDNDGLAIKSMEDGLGLTNNLNDLIKHEKFRESKREKPLSVEELHAIKDKTLEYIKEKFGLTDIRLNTITDYSYFFNALGFNISNVDIQNLIPTKERKQKFNLKIDKNHSKYLRTGPDIYTVE